MLHHLKSFLGISQTQNTTSPKPLAPVVPVEPTPVENLVKQKLDRDSENGQAEHNLKAFLMVIRNCEGTADERGYARLFGGRHFKSFDKHPEIYTPFRVSGKEQHSSAAGAYQFLFRTWDSLSKQYGYPDFSPEYQDKGAIELIKGRKALEKVKDGDFEEAIQLCAKEWASLPGSPYGQPVKTLEFCKKIYEQHGGTYGSDY